MPLLYKQDEQTIKEETDITCPYNDCKCKDLEVDDYYVGMPPLSSIIYVSWRCRGCEKSFSTEHTLDEMGEIKR